ncbi:hypothetical protein OXPF_24180 [Oxobacter pfennigii]|uniref:Uncharacterized protein n=1 Tax=Oxobacter pfennigii TaxID=36849 RepID=A0A0P8WNW2_9CLOT|nr:DUF6608 family protein [Oxobacter pfennigii]KPU44250.1 hypothetical protein OXPF_24180 [Oxobacter pfennigii]
MKEKLYFITRRYAVIYCVFYTITTIISSLINLYQGVIYDTHMHLINRAIVVLIGILAIAIVTNMNFKLKILNHIIPYTITMLLVLAYVWFTGLFDELHKNAYRDIFLNYTAIYAVITVIWILKDKYANKKVNNISS